MKKKVRVICILTSMIMVMTMTAPGVFATDGAAQVNDETAVTEPAEDQVVLPDEEQVLTVDQMEGNDIIYEESTEPIDEEQIVEEDTEYIPADEEQAVTEAELEGVDQEEEAVEERAPQLTQANLKVKSLAKPKNLKALSGYYVVKLSWSRVPNANYYTVERKSKYDSKWYLLRNVKGIAYSDYNVEMYQGYTYRVRAVRNCEGVRIKSPSAYYKKNPVSRMLIYVTFKRGKTFTNPDGSTLRISKGTRIATDGYGGGKYKFNRKGKTHTIANAATKNAAAMYLRPNANQTNNYTPEMAELFINSYVKKKGIRSGKKYLIWVSTYCQHMYIFKKKNGKWKYDRGWEISMGKASTPSPTGNKKIHKKIRYRHGCPYWSCYSSLNGLHGLGSSSWSKKLGKLASHGCIRNPNKKAKWIYNHCGNGTRVIVY